MSISEHQKEALQAMGVALLLLQTAEKVMRFAMTFVLPKNGPLTIDLLKEQEETERTKTLGYFFSELRKRANVHESFDDLLKEFLKNRNDFIHDLSRVPSWDFNENGSEARRFVHTLIWQTEKVVKVFSSLIMVWQEQTGMSEASPPYNEWFSDVEKSYKPFIDELFYSKND